MTSLRYYFKKHKRKYSRQLAFIYNDGVNKFPQQLFKMFSDRIIVFFFYNLSCDFMRNGEPHLYKKQLRLLEVEKR